MNIAELVNRVWQKLDDNATYYVAEEVILQGINPAMRLITYARGNLLTRRVAMTLNTEAATFNLRSFAPRLWQLDRLVLGTITGEDPQTSQDRYRPLTPVTLPQLAWRRDWILHRGTPRHYWHWGDHWLGLYPRAETQTTVTAIFQAVPSPFTVDDLTHHPDQTPELAPVHHELIADVALALLLMKEGDTEVAKTESILSKLLTQEQTSGLRRLARQRQMAQNAAQSPVSV